MITKDMKVLTLLEQHPESLEILLKISPHFNKLKNKVLRKALAGRVSIEQAASIAGVDLNMLLENLNNPESHSVPQTAAKTEHDIYELPEKPEVLKSAGAKIVTLDVRPILDSGEDPRSNIIETVKKLADDEVLQIVNSFEPIPLYTVLGKKGYSHWTEKTGDIYNVYFINDKNIVKEKAHAASKNDNLSEDEFKHVVELDVHGLPAPEPMIKILENLSSIDENTIMIVHHHREPVMLYPKLEERGFKAECKKISDEEYKILISRKREQ